MIQGTTTLYLDWVIFFHLSPAVQGHGQVPGAKQKQRFSVATAIMNTNVNLNTWLSAAAAFFFHFPATHDKLAPRVFTPIIPSTSYAIVHPNPNSCSPFSYIPNPNVGSSATQHNPYSCWTLVSHQCWTLVMSGVARGGVGQGMSGFISWDSQ